ncbi:MAG TPA: hypothetical protein VFO60_06835 [Candidatus Dormibacteraeota bacterium]|nr:hypothetical protein [Candidatus Dormibacteraeota bacterium]
MNRLETHAQTLPEGWKWISLFTPPEGFEGEWRTWLAQAQHAEEESLLAWWSRRGGEQHDEPSAEDGGDLLAA